MSSGSGSSEVVFFQTHSWSQKGLHSLDRLSHWMTSPSTALHKLNLKHALRWVINKLANRVEDKHKPSAEANCIRLLRNILQFGHVASADASFPGFNQT